MIQNWFLNLRVVYIVINYEARVMCEIVLTIIARGKYFANKKLGDDGNRYIYMNIERCQLLLNAL